MIIAVDYDGTIVTEDGYGKELFVNQKLIDELIKRKKAGDKLILWTCREGTWLEEAVARCKELGVEFDSVNESIRSRETCGLRKVIADIYIDDRAIMPGDFLKIQENPVDYIKKKLNIP